MTSKATEKIIDALTQLLEGYADLQEVVEEDFGTKASSESDEEGEVLSKEMDAALVIEMRAALETVMEAEDISSEELASVISILSDALEEIDPDAFAEEEEEDDDDEEDEDLDDDDDIDFDDDDLDEDDDDDEDE